MLNNLISNDLLFKQLTHKFNITEEFVLGLEFTFETRLIRLTFFLNLVDGGVKELFKGLFAELKKFLAETALFDVRARWLESLHKELVSDDLCAKFGVETCV